jgi:uncharacterized membrane protein YgcG
MAPFLILLVVVIMLPFVIVSLFVRRARRNLNRRFGRGRPGPYRPYGPGLWQSGADHRPTGGTCSGSTPDSAHHHGSHGHHSSCGGNSSSCGGGSSCGGSSSCGGGSSSCGGSSSSCGSSST